jgi:two-component system, NtrC family, response regulator AtoC
LENTTEIVRLLVVSREMAALRPLWSAVAANSWHLETAGSGWEALERVQSGVVPHVLILDVPRGDRDSLHILRWFRRLRPELPIVLLCDAADEGKKADAMRLGADDVLIRPVASEELERLVQRVLEHPKKSVPSEMVSENLEPLGGENIFVSASPLMQKLRLQVELLAQSDFPVLLLGEKGSGKQTTARLIHRLSVRSGFRFSKVNCTAMPADLLEREIFGAGNLGGTDSIHLLPGKLESVGKGTILLDEIAAMPADLQGRILGVLQDGQYARTGSDEVLRTHVRILASSSANIERALSEKKLREDLYYRLSAFTVQVPPLRQRKEEIRLLLTRFMQNVAKHYGLPAREYTASVIETCENHSWPGNLSELETFVKRYLIAGESGADPQQPELADADGAEFDYDASDLGPALLSADGMEYVDAGPKSLKAVVQSVKSEAERSAIAQALQKTGWNRKAAARLLKVSYRTLLYKIDQYRMNSSESFFSPLPPLVPPGAGKAK